ncbi:MAG: threonine--tRNA ligase [bacterium]
MSDNYADFKKDLPNYVNPENFELYKMRHSTEHVLHQAMQELYPGLKRAMGPATAEGFYHDFDFGGSVSEADFEKIEKRMQEIIAAKLPIVREEISRADALKLFKDNPYKLEWIEAINERDEKFSIYWTGEPRSKGADVDLCRGPHVDNTSEIKVFKLLSIAGAYWHGDEKNKMLTRIYGTAFKTQAELDKFLWQQEEAKKRDHRKLGKTLDLFTFSDLVGPGLPLFTYRGALIRRLLTNYIEELQVKKGYTQVWTPQMAKADLFKKSGHYDKYKDDMFRVVSNYSKEEYFLKPMNCPQHTQIYASRPRSYKDLPVRLSDFAMLYRDEKPGELHGLSRVRSFSQDDCHIFCRESQVDQEIDTALEMTKTVMSTFGFKYRYRLSTRDPNNLAKYPGDPKIWEKVELWAETIMKRNKIEYYPGPGEAAFYAPKMDLMATDCLGREWQLSTVQIDYVQPSRFELKFTNEAGEDEMPIMIHRAILGSPERFMMILIEHFAGKFPAWLAPEQVRLIPISDENLAYAEKVKAALEADGIRVSIDSDAERMQNKVRKAQEMLVPYMLILGKKEAEQNSVSIRYRSGEQENNVALETFVEKLVANVARKDLEILLK